MVILSGTIGGFNCQPLPLPQAKSLSRKLLIVWEIGLLGARERLFFGRITVVFVVRGRMLCEETSIWELATDFFYLDLPV